MISAGAYISDSLSDSEAAAILAAVRCMAREELAAAAVRDDADPYAEAEPFADLPDTEGHL